MKKRLIMVVSTMIAIIIALISIFSQEVLADDNTKSISLKNSGITVDGESISTNSTNSIFLSNSMNNGGTTEDSKKANKEITNVININSSGTYEFTGELSNGQISVNTNEIKGEVEIVLNNVDITCENAPAIFVYNKETNSSTCTVTIKTKSGSTNTITGGKIKQSVEGWSDQDSILYYIEKGTDDEGSYYERYKYDGAISSDISLNFEGEGTLTINSTEKEGIEVKRDLTINSGNYIINSLDDGINACTDGESVITINDGTILVNLKEEAEEGDGIDSNGSININGGKLFAFASEGSEDSGIDADLGININGGYVVGTGNMAGELSNDSKQEFLQLQFTDKVSKDTLITLVDSENNPIVAFKGDREYKVLTISTPDLENKEYTAYEGGEIEGTNENGLYTEITSYEKGTIKEYSNSDNIGMMNEFKNNMIMGRNGNIYFYVIIILAIILVFLVILWFVLKKKGVFEMKGKILTLVIGIIIGSILATAGFLIYNKINMNNMQDMRGGKMQGNGQMQNGEMPEGETPNGERPEMPENSRREKIETNTNVNSNV